MMKTHSQPLQDLIKGSTVIGELYEKLGGTDLRCLACGHRCLIKEGRQGVCRVRFNREGKLFVPFDYVGALQCDPIEKKPFFHALSGTNALSFGMLGCDFHCGYCQNWLTSQTLRDPASNVQPQPMSAEMLISLARKNHVSTIASTYNEPLITSEWAVHVFKHARQASFRTAYISNGNGTPEVLQYIRPWVDFYKIDLKSFNDRHYRELGGTLENILTTIRQVYEMGFWLEIVTLIIPGFNDNKNELTGMARFIASISPDIPWHVTAFHKDYKMTSPEDTTAKTLISVAQIGEQAGLRFIYAGNLPGQVGAYEHTRCPTCKKVLIRRFGYKILENVLTERGACPSCNMLIPGRWR